jgi:hypothetical protein
VTRGNLYAACALLLLAGCRTPAALRVLPGSDARPTRLLAAWAQRLDSRTALRATARLAVDAEGAGRDGGDVSFRSRQALVLERPAKLRVDVRGVLGETLAVLATDGEIFEMFEAADRHYTSGEVRDDLLWNVAHLALTPADAVEVILGAPHLAEGLSPGAAYDVGDGQIRIALLDAAGALRRQVEFDADGLLRWLQERRAGAVVWEVRFDDYALVEGAPVAHRLSIRAHHDTAHALLRLADVELNPALPPSIFRIDELAADAPQAAGERPAADVPAPSVP